VLVYDLLVDFAEVVSPFCGKLADSIVAVEPAPAWADFEAVEEIINIAISNIQRMSLIMQILVKHVAISQSKDHQMAASRDLNLIEGTL